MSTQSKHWWNKVAGEAPSECTCEKCGEKVEGNINLKYVQFVTVADSEANDEDAELLAVNVCDDCLYDMRKDTSIILTN